MIIVSSLSPHHSNSGNQTKAVESWQQYGECYSLNSREEIDQLEDKYEGVSFIPTKKTIEAYVGKKLVSINAMLDLASSLWQDVLIINSDIIILDLPELKQNGITIFSRYDYVNDINENRMFLAGYDGFFIPKQFLSIYPPFIYGMGVCFWDHSLPYRAMLKSIPVYWSNHKHLFHKVHPIRYDYQEWLDMGEFFRLEFKIDKQLTIPQMTTRYLKEIKSKLIVI